MYKKLVTFLVFSLYAPLAAFSADDPSRARLYIPVSTNATVSGCATCEIKASGYSARYVFGFGLGLGVASSKATVTGSPAEIGSDYSYDTGPMIDISFTFGSDFTFTLGAGVGSSPTTDVKMSENVKLEGKSAANTFLGLGYNFGSIEVLLALRSVSASYDMIFGGIPISQADVSWLTTDIGIGFTF